MNPSPLTRRRFLQSASGAATAALTTPAILPSSILGQNRAAPGNRITIGVIGLGAMGTTNLKDFLSRDDTQIVALCDVDREHHRDNPPGKGPAYGLDPSKRLVDKHYAEQSGKGSFAGPDTCSDFREVCARDDIDAIVVATPDHWHALCTLEALRAGKDVYCEKPITHLFAEGRAVCREVAKQNAIFQTGSQQRSDIRFRIAVEAVRNGLLGKVRTVEVGLEQGQATALTHSTQASDIPEGLDYDFWCGPGEKLPYIFARHHRNWRHHRAYGGGRLMDWIGHHNDIAHWGLGMDESGPEVVEAVGWTFPETGIYNTPVDYEIRCTYPGGISTSISSKHTSGTKWIGDDGWVHVDRGIISASNREWLQEKFDRGPEKLYVSLDHRGNFLEGIRSRKPCIAPAETAHRSITPGHLAFISQSLGRPLQWDAAGETVKNDPEADQLLKTVTYRKPWALS